jgi:signal transduction histidine kinase
MFKVINKFKKTERDAIDASPLLGLVSNLKQYSIPKGEVAESALRAAMDLVKADSGKVLLLDRHTRELITLADYHRKDLPVRLQKRLEEQVQQHSVVAEDRIIELKGEANEIWLCILFLRNRTRGAIILYKEDSFDAYLSDHIADLEILSEIVAETFEHSDIETEQRVLLEVFEELGGRLKLSKIFKHIEASLKQLFKCDGFSIMEKVERSDSNDILRNLYDSDDSLIGIEIPQDKGGLTWWTIQHKQHLLYKGEQDGEGRYIVYAAGGRRKVVKPFLPNRNSERYILTCPIDYKGQIFGAIRIYNTKSLSSFDDELDPELLSKIGIQAAIVIKNAEEFERANAQKTQSDAIQKIEEALSSTEPLGKVVQTCLQHAVKLVGGDMGFIAMRRLLSNKFTAPYTWKRDPDTIPHFDLDGTPEQLGIVGLVVAREEYYLTTDLQKDPHFIPRRNDINSKIVVPLRPPNEEIIGALSIDSHRKGAFSEHQVPTLQAIANDIALFISRAKFLEALTLLAKPFLKVDDVRILYEQTLTKLTEMLGVRVASIYRVEEGGLLVNKASTEGFGVGRVIPKSETLSWKAVETGETQEEFDLRKAPEKLYYEMFIEEHDLVSALSVPVRSNEGPLGVINIYANRPHTFSLLEKQLVELLAETLAINIHNVELIQKEKGHVKELEDAYKELAEAYDRLDKADQAVINNNRLMAIHEMVTAFVHDARNSLNRISPSFLGLKYMFVELKEKKQLRDKVQEEAEEGIQVITSELTNLSTYFEKLNNYARVLETIREENSINKVINSVLELMNPRISNTKRIKVKKNYTKDFEFVFDKGQIEQVISNLVLNAIQSMEKKGTTLYIETELVNKRIGGIETKCVRVRIRDDGMGIKAEDRPRIFDAFFTTKKGQGTGFGLTLCKKIVEENHQGLIDFDSEWNKGATFDVFLPYKNEG